MSLFQTLKLLSLPSRVLNRINIALLNISQIQNVGYSIAIYFTRCILHFDFWKVICTLHAVNEKQVHLSFGPAM